jgi:FecR protein
MTHEIRGTNPVPSQNTDRSFSRLLALSIVALAIFSTDARAGAAEDVGSIVSVSGTAQIERGGAILAAVSGTIVQVHDRVSTLRDASLTLEFSDGGSISLGESSSVQIEDGSAAGGRPGTNRVMLLSGRVHTVVPDKATGAGRTIEVDTPATKTFNTPTN